MPSGEFSKVSESMYYATRSKNGEDANDPHFMFNRGFYLGAQYAMRTSGELSPHLARFLEFVMWLTEREEPTESERNLRQAVFDIDNYADEDD